MDHDKMAQFRQKTVYVIFDDAYKENDYSNDLGQVLESIGYQTEEKFIDGSPASYQALATEIPKDAIVFLHVDLPGKVVKGTQIDSVRFLEKAFPYVAGFTSAYAENSIWKSTMNEHFARENIPHAQTIRIENVQELQQDSMMQQLEQISKPAFIKVDDGYDSEGLSERCVAQTTDEIITTIDSLTSEFGPVTVQPFLCGREFTVAVTPKHTFHPIERLFGVNQTFSPSGGTEADRPLPNDETALIEECQKVARDAYTVISAGCYSYGRVDLRCDGAGKVHALEVNNTCSFGENSYFSLSCKYGKSSREDVLREIMDHQIELWCNRKDEITNIQTSSKIIYPSIAEVFPTLVSTTNNARSHPRTHGPQIN